MRRLLTTLALLIPISAAAQITDVSTCGGVGCTRESLRVPLNGVIRFTLPSGQSALVQFTSFSGTTATYRWKYWALPKGEATSGAGNVVEKYESFPAPNGKGNQVLPLPGHDLIIRAGDVRVEWSLGGDDYCYVYFNPMFARGLLLDASAFASDP